jgi:hypothetical protein
VCEIKDRDFPFLLGRRHQRQGDFFFRQMKAARFAS